MVGHTMNIIKSVRSRLNAKLDEAKNHWDHKEVVDLERELEKLYSQEELYWKQRSRDQ